MATSAHDVHIDPNGDTWIILKHPKQHLKDWHNYPNVPPAAEAASHVYQCSHVSAELDDMDPGLHEVRFLVSSRQMRIVSKYFNNLFKHGFREATPENTDGKYHISAEGFNSTAFTILLNVVHVRMSNIPRMVTLEMLCHIGVILNYYDMASAVEPWCEMWIKALKVHSISKPPSYESSPNPYRKGTVLWLFVAWIFRDEDVFYQMSTIIWREARGPVQDLGLPMPLLDKFNQSRCDLIFHIIGDLKKVLGRLQQGELGCNSSCNFMLLGAMTRKLIEAKILVRGVFPKAPFEGLTIVDPLEAMGDMSTPEWKEKGKPGKQAHGKDCDLFKLIRPTDENYNDMCGEEWASLSMSFAKDFGFKEPELRGVQDS